MKRRILMTLLSVVLVFSNTPVSAFAAPGAAVVISEVAETEEVTTDDEEESLSEEAQTESVSLEEISEVVTETSDMEESVEETESNVSQETEEETKETVIMETTVEAVLYAEAAEENTPDTALTDADFLKANGKNLRNNSGEGDVVNLRGTNAGGYLLQEFWMTPTQVSTNVRDQKTLIEYLQKTYSAEEMLNVMDIYESSYWTETDFDRCADMGMNVIRLPFWYRNLVDENGNFYGYDAQAEDPYAEAFALMDWFVAEAKERGMYVIIDFHGAPGSQNGSDHSGVDGQDAKEAASEFFFGDSAQANQELYYDIWEVVANRYNGEPAVAGYDLLNEPFCTYRYNSKLSADELHELLWGIYDIAYDKIRAVDPDHVIIMEATWDPVDLPNPAEYGWENVMYEYHNYLYDDYDNTAGGQISNMEKKLTAIAFADYNVPSYMGEFCYFNNYQAWDDGLKLLTEAGINWTTWTYKTIEYYGNWGLYHHPAGFNDGINVETASLEEIKTWYGRMNEDMEPNEGLIEVVSKYLKEDVQENEVLPNLKEINEGSYYLVAALTENVVKAGDSLAAASRDKDTTNKSHMFAVENNDDDTISLKSLLTEKYVTVGVNGVLTATAETITDTEKFYLQELTSIRMALKSKSTGFYVTCREADEYVLEATSYQSEGNESFYFVNENDRILGDVERALHSGWTRMEAETATLHPAEGVTIPSGEEGNMIPRTEAQSFYSEGWAAAGLRSEADFEDIAADFSNVNYVEFTVDAPAEGDYQMIIQYNGDDQKVIAVKANDSAAQKIEIPAKTPNHDWDALLQHAVIIPLKEGENTIRVTGTLSNSAWMNIDCIDICDSPIQVVNGAIRLEGEDFYHTGGEESQSFFSGGTTVGGLNSGTAVEDVLPSWKNVKYVDFTIYCEEETEYTVNWAYNGNGADGMIALYRVNGGENQVLTLNNAGASWNKMNSVSFDVTLQPGFNSLQLSGTIANSNDWANIDYIELLDDSALSVAPVQNGYRNLEAENAQLFGTAAVVENDAFSYQKGVGSIDNTAKAEEVGSDWSSLNYITYSVEAPSAGKYYIALHYQNTNADKLLVKVNSGETQVVTAGTDTGYLVLDLTAGTNTISVTGAMGNGSISHDYMEITKKAIPVVYADKNAARYEAEDFAFKSNKNDAEALEAQDFYSGGLCVGGLGFGDAIYTEGMDFVEAGAPWVKFTVFAEKEGTYSFNYVMNGKGADMPAAYQINGQPSKGFMLMNDGHSWNQIGYGAFEAPLEKGFNEVIVSGSITGSGNSWDDWVNLDYLDVTFVSESDGGNTGGGDEGGNTGGGDGDNTDGDDKIPEGEVPDGIWIKEILPREYTGAAIKIEPVVYDKTTKLINKKDYTVTYKNNTKAYTYTDEDYAAFEEKLEETGKREAVGTFDPKKAPQVVIKMKGNYSGTSIVYFKIEQADITDDAFDTNDITVTYSGKKQTPAPTLTWNGKKLKYGTDFYVPEYDAAKKDKDAFKEPRAEGYDLTIVGKKNFTGEIPFKLVISDSKKQIAMNKITVKGLKNVSWTGEQIVQTGFTVKYKTDVLSEENGDYTIEWGINKDVGEGSVTFTGTGLDTDQDGYSYIGTKTVTFKITGISMSKVSVAGVEKNYTYTGEEIKPVATLTYKANKNAEEVPLDEDTHYSVRYEKNVDKGTATIVYTGLENMGYTGTKKVTFKITPAGIGDVTEDGITKEQIQISFADTENIQDGVYVAPIMKGGATPEVVVTYGETVLKAGKDYTVKYSNNKQLALSTDDKAPTVTVKGIGNYKDTKNATFSIGVKPLTNENGISIVAKDKPENNMKNGYRQSFKVYDADGKALSKKDYDTESVVYTLIESTGKDGQKIQENKVLDERSVVAAGSTIQITVTGINAYAGGSATGTYRIIKKNYDIAKATIQIVNQTYTGEEILITEQSQFKEGKVFLKVNGEKEVLILGEDIEVVPGSYVKNVAKGTAKVTFRGIGEFGGTKTVSFKIGTRSVTDFWEGFFGTMSRNLFQ